MSFIQDKLAQIPFLKKADSSEYYFALNIGLGFLTASLWTISDNKLHILNTCSLSYSSTEHLITVTDQLLDKVLADFDYEPKKILFGVPDSWLLDDNLKEDYLKLLRHLVKELELSPMAYVATSHALSHILEKKEGALTTAILAGIYDQDLMVTVVRTGKSDGTKVISRGDNLGTDMEKALLSFTEVEVLPSKILIYGSPSAGLEKVKADLLTFSWMNKLSFLHFPKIETLEDDIEIKAVSFAGAVELEPGIKFEPGTSLPKVEVSNVSRSLTETDTEDKKEPEEDSKKVNGNLGFVMGDVTENKEGDNLDEVPAVGGEEERVVSPRLPMQASEDLQQRELSSPKSSEVEKVRQLLSSFVLPLPSLQGKGVLVFIPIIVLSLLGAYLFFSTAKVSVYVEPQLLEKDTQVTADPAIKAVDEENKKIPGEMVSIQVSGKDKASATGSKQVGDAAKGSVVIYNKTYDSKTFSKGTSLSTPSGLKFTLDSSVTVASQSAIDTGITFGKVSSSATASDIGADSNIASGTEMTIASLSSSQFSAKADNNFAGGTSRQVTVINDGDQKKLLAQLASTLRKQAQQQLQEKYPGKKILEEALAEDITKKSYSKNVNDQAQEFSLDLTISYKGIAYSDDDLKRIVSKLVNTSVPDGFELNLDQTETQADVAKIDKDKLIFLARFKAKLMPKINTNDLKAKIRGKTPAQAAEELKSIENILGSDIELSPKLPSPLQRLPFLDKNIQIQVGLK